MEYPSVRNLDGVYYRVQRKGKWLNICYSDLTQEERNECTKLYTLSQMKQLADILADTLHAVGDSFDLIASSEDE